MPGLIPRSLVILMVTALWEESALNREALAPHFPQAHPLTYLYLPLSEPKHKTPFLVVA